MRLRKILFLFLLIGGAFLGQAQAHLRYYTPDASEVTSYSAAPKWEDQTHFQEVSAGTDKSLVITVQNDYYGNFAFLGMYLSPIVISGPDASAFSVSGPTIDYLFAGQTTTFTLTFSPTSDGVYDATVSILPFLGYIFEFPEQSFQIRGISGDLPVLSIFSASGERVVSSASANTANGTDFGAIDQNVLASSDFYLINEGSAELELSGSTLGNLGLGTFTYDAALFNSNLAPQERVDFTVDFQSAAAGLFAQSILIDSNDPEEASFEMQLVAESVAPYAADLMIAQYQENGQNDYVEVVNTSGSTIASGSYYLGQYRRNRRLDRAPNNFVSIPELAPGEVFLTDGFNLRGNELLVISPTRNNTCYENRIDIIGIQNVSWGNDRSLVKGACASETAHLEFDAADWIELTLDEVNASSTLMNTALGTHQLGTIHWDGSQWTDGRLPDRTRAVYIDGLYTADFGGLAACDLYVNQTLDFDRSSTASVVVYRNLDIQASFLIGDQESLVTYDDQATINGQIEKKESSTYRNNAYDFTYWASPVEQASVSTVFQGVTASRIFYYDQSRTSSSDPNHPDYWSTWQNANGQMSPGLGYAAEGPTGQTGVHDLAFVGTPNNGRIEQDINFWDDADLDNDFNMLGNPYPCAIDIEKFFDANAGLVEPVVYLWTHTTSISGGDSGDFNPDDYATYNYTGGTGIGNGVGSGPIPSKNIGSAQGFFMRALQSGTIHFDNSMKMEDANTQFFKQPVGKKQELSVEEKDRLWLNLSTDEGGFSQILIGFLANTTEDFDLGYDAEHFADRNVIQFYSSLEDRKMVIQSKGAFDAKKEIDLGFSSKVAPRRMSVSLGRLEGQLKKQQVYLYDRVLDKEHLLSDGPYTFSLEEEGDYAQRFSLRFFDQSAVLSNDEFEVPERLSLHAAEQHLAVQSVDQITSIKVYNILGMLLATSNPAEQQFELFIPNSRKGQVLLIDLQTVEGQTLRTKSIMQ